MIRAVKKRTGELVTFDSLKIKQAIEKAMHAVDEFYPDDAREMTKEVVKLLESKQLLIPSVEEIQDCVEEILSKSKFQRTAKAYMLYRRSRANARELKNFFGIKDDMKFDVNAIKVLQERYLLKDSEGRIIETPTQMFMRVAKAVASAEKNRAEYEDKFFEIMKNLEFLPNSPTLMNAGTEIGQLSACFVLPIEDSLESIFNTLKQTALIQQSGGGTGFNFSRIRPKGDIVKSTKGIASGPVSFIKIYDATTDTIKQGGKRRGANMAILNVSHPDILEFITSKQKERQLSNFNISVGVDDKFFNALEKDGYYDLVNPSTNKIVSRLKARDIFDAICHMAWACGDPGMVFLDEINRKNQVPGMGKIEATNPCGEVPLFSYESCNLGSINLTKFVKDGKIEWERLKYVVHLSVRFLDNIISINKYPFKELKEIAESNRRIGLGVMGFAEMLILLGIPYDSDKAVKVAETVMQFINKEAHIASQNLGAEKGNFPNFHISIWKNKVKNMRNCALTTIAPTGTISIIAGCSSGIEPLFAISYIREILSGKRLFETNKIFQSVALKEGFYSDKLMRKIALHGNLKNTNLPKRIKSLFKTALEINYSQHIRIQAAFQKHTDNAVSKTINLPKNAKVSDIKKAYLLAYKLKCKGITIYRYGSKSDQVLYLGEGKKTTKAKSDYAGSCIGKVCTF